MESYYYEKLTTPQKSFYRDLCEGFRNRAASVKATPGLTEEEFLDTVEAVRRECPEFWYVDLHHRRYKVGPTRYELTVSYYYDEESTRRRQAAIDRYTDLVLAAMARDHAESVYEKCLWLHNMMVRNCTYDDDAIGHSEERWTAYTLEGFFLFHRAVCSGVSMAYRYLCSKVGVDAVYASGYSLEPGKKDYGRHAWNIIRSGESCAQVDVTWDMNLSKDEPHIRFDYFFLPDIEMMRDHQYVGYPICRQGGNSYFERLHCCIEEADGVDRYLRDAVKKAVEYRRDDRPAIYFKIAKKRLTAEQLTKMVADRFRKHIVGSSTLHGSHNPAQSVFYFWIELGPDARFRTPRKTAGAEH